MKNIIFSILLLVGCFTFSFGQDTGTAAIPQKPKFEWNAESMDKAGIAADVQTKITDIIKVADDAFKVLRKNKELTPESLKAQIKIIRDKSNADVQALLTDEQKKKIKEIRKGSR